MDLPKPPPDIELRNIIDKLAQFVARNGPEFEQMTKNKQKGNPKFGFLFGGEHFNYYQYKVTTEQAILKQKLSANCSGVGQGPPTSSVNSLSLLAAAQHSPSIQTTAGIQGSQLSLAAAAVTAAQWLVAQQQSQVPTTVAHTPLSHPPSVGITIENITQQQAALQDQIRQSELNLSAQHSVLMQQQQAAIEEAIEKAKKVCLLNDAAECGLNFSELDTILQPIIDSCTKDSISNGKAWILQRANSDKANHVISRYLLSKIFEPGRTFLHKLHIIYLVNDILHHCARKNVDGLRKSLENVVVPMFCNTSMDVNDEQKGKLNKLLNLWESKNHYCTHETVAKLKQPVQSWSEYQAELIAEHSNILTPITNNTKSTFQNYTSQHQAFVTHALQQIQTLEQQRQTLEQTLEAQKQVAAVTAAAAVTNVIVPPVSSASGPPGDLAQPASNVNVITPNLPQKPDDLTFQQQLLLQQTAALNQLQDHQQPPPGDPGEGPVIPAQPQPSLIPVGLSAPSVVSSDVNVSVNSNSNDASANSNPELAVPPDLTGLSFTQPPPGFPPVFPPPGIELPDLSQPPPGFLVGPPPPPPTATEVLPDDLLPSLPYYDLPAGLMVPLVKLEDCNYKPLDPDEIRLPPPAAPNERLLAAFKSFYAAPGHSHPRDTDGWEKLGLYEYYRAKNAAKKKKEDDIAEGKREKSKSPSPITRPRSRSKTPPPKKRYRSRSRSRSKGRESRSPQAKRNNSNYNNNNNRRNNRNRGRTSSGGGDGGGSRSGSNASGTGGSGDIRSPRSKSRSRSRSRSRSPHSTPLRQENRDRDTRSPTPPSFMGSSYGKISTERLDENNKGHQMLRKMGWGGAGLGAKEQGIEQPIDGGEIRDRTDMYKGVGLNLNDPYENFRKSKGQAFITRMKARAEERVHSTGYSRSSQKELEESDQERDRAA